MEKNLKAFIQSNTDSHQRWLKFKDSVWPSVFSFNRKDPLTPFYNTSHFQKLSNDQKTNLYKSFIQFNAEALILLELILYEGMGSLRKKRANEELQEASLKIMNEEKDHTMAFIRFLKNDCPSFARNSFLLRQNKKFKNSFLWLARNFPVGLALPAAKVEAYTVFYGRFLEKVFDKNQNSWVQLNSLHLLDEGHHIGFEFNMYEEELGSATIFGKITAVCATVLCILHLQICFLIGSARIVKKDLKTRGFLATLLWTLRLGTWILKEFEPYIQTRFFLKKQFILRQPSFGFIFKFMYR